jgi:hypothetical protein
MVRSKSNVKYYAKQIKHIIMRKDIVYLGMIRCSDIMSLNTSDEGYNNGKKYGQKGAICGPNTVLKKNQGSMQKRNLKISTMIKPSQQDSRTSGTKGSLVQEGRQIKRKTFQKYNASTVKSTITTGTSVPS